MKLLLLLAEKLPRTVRELRGSPPTAEVSAILPALADGRSDEAALLERLASVPARPAGVKIIHPRDYAARSKRDALYTVHDQFFGVYRTEDDAPEMFAHAVLVGYRGVLSEVIRCGTSLNDERWGELRCGLEEAIRFASGAPPVVPDAQPPPQGTQERDPHRRWRTGHHAFFPLIQAIVIGLNCFESALLEGDEPVAAQALRFATTMMRASANAMRFAADFLPSEYAGAVRPAMAPPYLPIGLSGVMSEDHARLIHCFREIRELIPGLRGDLAVLRDGFVAAVESAYETHQGVCARFDGEHIVSLRMSKASSERAADVLEHLKNSRLKMMRSS